MMVVPKHAIVTSVVSPVILLGRVDPTAIDGPHDAVPMEAFLVEVGLIAAVHQLWPVPIQHSAPTAPRAKVVLRCLGIDVHV